MIAIHRWFLVSTKSTLAFFLFFLSSGAANAVGFRYQTSADMQVLPEPIEHLENKSYLRDFSLPAQIDNLDLDYKLPDGRGKTFVVENNSSQEPQVTIVEIVVTNLAGESIGQDLEDVIYSVINIRAGQASTRASLQEDINAIFTTGYFSSVRAVPVDTPLGVKVTFVVKVNPVLSRVLFENSQVLPDEVIQDAFADQYGQILNLIDLRQGIQRINEWYQENNYVLAQITDTPKINEDGTVTLTVAEGIIENVQVRFIDENGNELNENGEPIDYKTNELVIIRELQSKPGEVFNQVQIQQDLQNVFGLGIFDDVRLSLEPGSDPRKVDVIVNVVEGQTHSFDLGLGFNTSSGVFLSSTYGQDNFLGQAQTLDFEVKLGLATDTLTNLTISLNSPGVLNDTSSRLSDIRSQILLIERSLDLSNSSPLERATRLKLIEKAQKILEVIRISGHEPLEILALNNLGRLYEVDSDYVSAQYSYDEALSIVERSGSPALEFHLSMAQARSFRNLGEVDRALNSYIRALEIFESHEGENDIVSLIGDDFFNVFKDEWQLEANQSIGESFENLSTFIKTGIILDIAFTYSMLGDYQAGLYSVSSPTLSNASTSSINYLGQSIGNGDSTFNFLDIFNEDFSLSLSDSLRPQMEALLLSARDNALRLVNNLPGVYQLQTLELLFSDFGELETANIYEEEIDDIALEPKNEVMSTFYLLVLFFTSEEYLSSASVDSDLIQILKGINVSFSNAFNTDTYTWNQSELQETFNILFDYVVTKIDGSDDLAQIKEPIIELVSLSFDVFSSADRFQQNSRISDLEIVQYIETILDGWPTNIESIQKFEWLKGFLLKYQADAYRRLNDNELAVSAYEDAILWLSEAEEFVDSDFDNSDQETNEFLSQATALFGDSLISEVIIVPRLDAHLYSADLYLSLQNPRAAVEQYEQALILSNQLSKRTLIYKQSEKAEIYYGIARAEWMLGNLLSAERAVAQAISINEVAFPYESLSGGPGITFLGLNYGYGIPYRGRIEATFNLESQNPWLSKNADNSPSAERRCATVTQYFSCRQKYFSFYIDILLQKHQNNPSAGFDVQAFEASEQARAFNFGRPRGSREFTDFFAAPQSLEKIRSEILDEDTVILEFFLGNSKSYLWVIAGNDNLRTYELPPRSVIEEKAEEFYNLLTSPTGRVRPRTTAEVGQELSEILFGQITDQLGTQRLVIIADGFIQYLPFSVLPNPSPDNFPTETALDGEYGATLNPLLLDHEIVYLPSASTLVTLRQNSETRPQPSQELAFFANPVFNHRDNRVEQVKLFDWSEPFTEAELADVEVLYSEIPSTEQELEGVLESNLLPEDQVQRFLGYDAELETALSPELGRFRIVHFASHGIFNSNAPERSGIVLSGLDENGVVQAGLLSPAYAFDDMNLSATELVVLSGCRTGLSQGQVGREGMTGLTNGLFDAGAERVVASLWSVRDDATRELMNRFYQRMLDPERPMRPAEALTEAQRSMWNDPRWQTPYEWAAFTIQGEWR